MIYQCTLTSIDFGAKNLINLTLNLKLGELVEASFGILKLVR